MSTRSCPTCGLDVAAHQTLCPSCRTPVPSEAGPVAASAEGSGIVVGAPPPRRDPGAPDAPPPPVVAAPEAVPAPSPPVASPVPPAAGPAPVPVEPTAPPPPAAPPSAFAPPAHGPAAGSAPPVPPPAQIAPAPIAPPPLVAPPAAPAPSWASPAVAPASAGTLGVPGAPILDERGNLVGGIVALIGAALVVVGVFLPWMEVAGEPVSGWESSADAKVLVGLAAGATVIGALLIGGARSLVLRLGLAFVGITAVVIGVIDALSVSDLVGDVDQGSGLVVVMIGGVVLVNSALLTRHRRFR